MKKAINWFVRGRITVFEIIAWLVIFFIFSLVYYDQNQPKQTVYDDGKANVIIMKESNGKSERGQK